MKLSKSVFLGATAALALAVGSVYAADQTAKAKSSDPGFNNLDKNNDGYLSSTEAAGNPDLAKKFKQADKNNDGKLSRAEYLAVMGKKDAATVKDKVVGAGREVKQEAKERSSTGSTAPAAPANPK
jgi:Ca2+-binding EF-hand superfamily protein